MDLGLIYSLQLYHLLRLNQIDHRRVTNRHISLVFNVDFAIIIASLNEMCLNFGNLLAEVDILHTFFASWQVCKACSTDSDARQHLSHRV